MQKLNNQTKNKNNKIIRTKKFKKINKNKNHSKNHFKKMECVKIIV